MNKHGNDADCSGNLLSKDKRLKFCFWISIIIVFLYSSVLSAQTIELPKPQTETEQKIPEPEKPAGIPITEVSDRAQETNITLNKIKAR